MQKKAGNLLAMAKKRATLRRQARKEKQTIQVKRQNLKISFASFARFARDAFVVPVFAFIRVICAFSG
jgi:hypothetical protein